MKRVIVNGTFDILHAGHVKLLEFARLQGDYLTVAIDADARVRKLKGSDRPINNQSDRQRMLEGLTSVNEVKIFNTDEELVKIIQDHDVMVKGSDYRDKPVIGEALVEVIFYERTEHSTTRIIQNIIDRR